MPSRRGIALLALVLLAAVSSAPGEDRPVADRARLTEEIARLFAEHDYRAAAEKCREAIATDPANPDDHYNLACALARMGEKDASFAELDRATAVGYSDVGHLLDDDDIGSLTGDPRFIEILKKARKNQIHAARGQYEGGGAIAGVKMLEGDPAGGLRWRLRYRPDMDREHPCRLMIWMHPSGASANAIAENMSPMLASHHLALMVFTQKDFRSWSEQDAQSIAASLLDVEKKAPGLEIRRPLLIGFSAGAQMALNLWAAHPGDFGALVLDAGYPLNMAAYAQGKVAVLPLPNNPAISQTPILVFVGTEDGGSRVWKSCQDSWQKAGVPLTVRYVEGRKHEWMLNVDAEQKALEDWLSTLSSQPETRPSGAAPSTQPNAASK